MAVVLENVRVVEDLDALKAGLHEASRQDAEIVDLGTMQVLGVKFLGGIGPEPRLQSGELTHIDIEAHKSLVTECYIPVPSGATGRCVDGRPTHGYSDTDSASFTEAQGPQNVAGTAGFALCGSVSSHAAGRTISYGSSYERATENTEVLGYRTGNHTGDHCKPGCIDCGGWDRKIETLRWIADGTDEVREAVKTYYGALGREFSDDVFDQMVEGSHAVCAQTDYFPGLEDFIQLQLSRNPEAIEPKAFSHTEVEAIENMVHGTTQHTNHVNARTANKTQSFGNDGWHRDDQIARMPADEKKIFEMSHIAFTIGTLKHIGHESLGLRARLPKN